MDITVVADHVLIMPRARSVVQSHVSSCTSTYVMHQFLQNKQKKVSVMSGVVCSVWHVQVWINLQKRKDCAATTNNGEQKRRGLSPSAVTGQEASVLYAVGNSKLAMEELPNSACFHRNAQGSHTTNSALFHKHLNVVKKMH